MADLIQKIINFITSLLGGGGSTAKLPSAGPTPHPSPAPGAAPSFGGGGGSGHLNANVASYEEQERDGEIKILVRREGAFLIVDADDPEAYWVKTDDTDVPPAQWQDVWGPLANAEDQLTEFSKARTQFELKCTSDPQAAEQILIGMGYSDAGQYYRAETTILKHHGTASGSSTLGGYILNTQAVASAAMAGASALHDKMIADQQASGALEPIEGVSCEDYAALAAFQAQSPAPDKWQAALASKGMDAAKYDRVSKGWMDRMSKDTTAAIATVYGRAFQGAGQGQFGAATQAAGATKMAGVAAGGTEPFSFEKYCEIQGATQAWSNTGQDVNALLQSKFGMNGAEWAGASTWWGTQMQANISMFDEYAKKTEHYEKQYSAGAPAAPDGDISF